MSLQIKKKPSAKIVSRLITAIEIAVMFIKFVLFVVNFNLQNQQNVLEDK